eukprot:g13235.t1
MHVDIQKLDNKVECVDWKQRPISSAKTVGWAVIGDTERLVPVGDPNRSSADFERDGYKPVEIDRGLQARNLLQSALVRQSDLTILDRSHTAREALDDICWSHEPEMEGTKLDLLDRLLRFVVPRSSEPTHALLKLEGLAARLRSRGIPLDPAFIFALFVRCLPREYAHAKETLMGLATMDREDVLRRVNTQYAAFNHGTQIPAGEQAYFAGAIGIGQQGKKGKNGGGGKGDGGGGGGGHNGNGGGKSNGDAKSSWAHRLCFTCGHPGHSCKKCSTPEADFRVCKVCRGKGHKGDQCPSRQQSSGEAVETANIAEIDQEDPNSEDDQAF